MANILLNKLLNDEINKENFVEWLLHTSPQQDNQDFKEISACNVAQIDFITYFLNFIHENISCNKSGDTANNASPSKASVKIEGFNNGDLNQVSQPTLFKRVEDKQPSQNFTRNNNVEDKLITPKVTPDKHFAVNDSYFSPVSPLYQNHHSFSKLDDSKRLADKHTICLGDFLVNNTKSSKKKKIELVDNKRRINLTSICGRGQKVDVLAQTNLLGDGQEKVLPKCDNVMLKNEQGEVKVAPNKVTFKKEIDCFVDVYVLILKNRLVLNVVSEVHFLVSLLLTKQIGDSYCDNNLDLGVDYLDTFKGNYEKLIIDCPTKVFESVHNIVYFAVKCLEAQIHLIKFCDKATIKLLSENERFQQFSPVLSKKLYSFEKKIDKLEIVSSLSQPNVCFNIDTDNKDNFPNEVGFHAFRKQRDLFYEILRVWENNHLLSQWSFSLGLSGRIKALFSLSLDPTNYMHLARLFKNQLLSNCAKGPKEKGLSENSLTFLSALTIDAEKLNRLTNRLVTKQTTSGINMVPVFNGYQEFYKEFVVVASNYSFNKHLCDCFVAEIVELNETKFLQADLEKEVNVDVNTKRQYIHCIKDLRILAKFLGFVESLPYKSEFNTLPRHVLQTQINTRAQCTPSLDIQNLLNIAVERRTLVLLIPWITKYLSMLDFVTLRLPYYAAVNQLLFQLYRNSCTNDNTSYNWALTTFCLGWMFELPHFPNVEYFNFCSKVPQKADIEIEFGKVKNKSIATALDCLNIVSQEALYVCCPYLEEIKKLLSANYSSNKISVKYITPVTAVESNNEITRKKLQQQLEEAFFNGQPPSVRKTVEFVSERVASAAVKHLCHELVPTAKQEALKDLKDNLLKEDYSEKYPNDIQRKAILKKQAASLAQIHLDKLLEDCEEELVHISNKKIPVSIESLLPLDALEELRNACVGLTIKMYMERVKQWLNAHVTVTVFMKDFDNEIHKVVSGRRSEKGKSTFMLPSSGRGCSHNEETLSGFHVLNSIREMCCSAIENVEVPENHVVSLVKQTYRSLTERNDINDVILSSVCTTLFDLCLLLISKCCSFVVRKNIICNFMTIWNLQHKPSTVFKNFFCPRNLKLLQTSKDQTETWNIYAKFVARLVDEKCVPEYELEAQCTGFYSRDWDEVVLSNFSVFLKNFLSYSECYKTSSKSVMLLNFLSDFCLDL